MICANCGQEIFDKRKESGCKTVDWATDDGDFGCDYSVETTSEGVGDHKPEIDQTTAQAMTAMLEKIVHSNPGSSLTPEIRSILVRAKGEIG